MNTVLRRVKILEVDSEDTHYGWVVGDEAFVYEESDETVYYVNVLDSACASWLNLTQAQTTTATL